MKRGEVILFFVFFIWLVKVLLGDRWDDPRLAIVIFFYLCSRIPKWLGTSKEEGKCTVEDGKLKYDFDLSNSQDILDKEHSIGDKAELPLQEIKDMALAVNEVDVDDIDGTEYIYTLNIFADKDIVSYTVKEEQYDQIFKVFEKIYPMLAEKYKRNFVNYIINANAYEKYTDKTFHLVMHDDGFIYQKNFKSAKNPFDKIGVYKFLTLKWSDVCANLSSDNRECVLTSEKEKTVRYVISVKRYMNELNPFDYYVIWDIINDLHREGVERLSELSYVKNQAAEEVNKEA